MSVTVKGVYQGGAVVLLEKPPGLREGPVKVTLTEEEPPEPVFLQYGKYAEGMLSTEDDFHIAEWRGEHRNNGAQLGR